MINGSILQEDIQTLNMYVINNTALKYLKQNQKNYNYKKKKKKVCKYTWGFQHPSLNN